MKMKNRTLVLWSILMLMLIVMAGQPQKAQARDHVYVGADLGGFGMTFNNYSHHERMLPPCPPRGYYPQVRYQPPPPPVYYGEYYEYQPRHHRHHHHHHWQEERW